MGSYKDLDAWKNAMELVKEVYLLTKKFPKEEMYGLISQTKRAAVSVPSNIAEGIRRTIQKRHTAVSPYFQGFVIRIGNFA